MAFNEGQRADASRVACGRAWGVRSAGMGNLLARLLASITTMAMLAACSAGADDTAASSSSGPGQGGGSGQGGGASDGGGDASITVQGSTGTGSFNGEACGTEAYGNAVPAGLLIVLDKSGSMAGGDGQPDKWAPTVSAVTQLTQTAPQQLKVGLTPFPGDDCDWDGLECSNLESQACKDALADGCCEDVSPAPAVPVQPLSQSGPLIVEWMNGNGPNGGTPTLWALKRGYHVMKTLTTEGERFVLLVTDGDPNVYTPEQTVGGQFTIPESNIECKTTADIVAEAASAAAGDPPVKTYVIGSPGVSSEGMRFLSDVATAGLTAPDGCSVGVDCHFQIGTADFQAELQTVLETIAGAISDCVFALPEGEDVDPDKVNVVIDTPEGPIEVYRDTTHTDGWDYTDATQTKIQLFGPACELYQSLTGDRITIVLGCNTVLK